MSKGYCWSDDSQNKRCKEQCDDCKNDQLNTPEIGDTVLWQYTHHLNSRSTTEIVKEGVLIARGTKKKRSPFDWTTHIGIVNFKGNKTNSRIAWEQLRKKY